MSSAAKPHLDLLASEIILMICEVLAPYEPGPTDYTEKRSDIPNFRLVNKRCAAIGAKVLCRSLHVMFTVKSFQNLLKITRHPVLSEHVFEVRYDAVFLEDVEEEEYKERVLESWMEMNSEFDAEEDFESMEDMAETMFTEEWEVYESMLSTQQYLKSTNFDSSVFAEAFCHLPNLRSICVSMDHFYKSSTMDAYDDIMGGMGGFVTCGGDGELCSRALGSTLLSIPRASKIDTLKLWSINWSFFKPPPQGLDPYPSVFQQLRSISLKFESTHCQGAVKCHKNLGHALRSCLGLEVIDLELGIGFSGYDPCIYWNSYVQTEVQDIFGDFTWSKLRILKIATLASSEPRLISLLRRHAPTLRHLKLDSLLLTGSNRGWGKLLGLMRKDMSLEKLELTGAWSRDKDEGGISHQEMSVKWVARLCDAIVRKEKVNIVFLKSRKDAMERHTR